MVTTISFATKKFKLAESISYSNRFNHLLPTRDVQILKFLSPRQSTDFDQKSAVSPRLQQERNIGSTSIRIRTE